MLANISNANLDKAFALGLEKSSHSSYKLLLIFIILLFSRDTLFVEMKYEFYTATYIVFSLVVCILFFVFFLQGFYFNIKALINTLLLASIVLITMTRMGHFEMRNLFLVSSVFLAFLCASVFTYSEFSKYYILIMLILSSFSLFANYFLKSILQVFPISFPILENSVGYKFYDMFFCFVPVNPSEFRNYGIFREPAIFQVFLNVALYFKFSNLHANKKKDVLIVFIFIVTIISTYSLAGVIFLSLIIFAFFVDKARTTSEINMKKALILIIFLLFSVLLFSEVQKIIVRIMLSKLSTGNESTDARVLSVVSNYQAWTGSLVGGIGPSNVLERVSSNTSTSTALLASQGLIFFLIHSFLIFKSMRLCSSTMLAALIASVGLFAVLNGSMLMENQIIWILLFSPFMKSRCHGRELFVKNYLRSRIR